MHRDDGLLNPRRVLADSPDQLPKLPGQRVAHRIGDVQCGGALRDRGSQYFIQELGIRPAGILRRELDVLAVRAGVRDHGARGLQHLLAGHAQLVLHVHVRRGDERMDATARGIANAFPGLVDIVADAARQPADDRALRLPRDALHCLQVPGRGGREPRLDHVNAEMSQLPRNLQFLLRVQRSTRRLLSIPQGRVEDDHVIHGYSPGLSHRLRRAWRRAEAITVHRATRLRRPSRPAGACARQPLRLVTLGKAAPEGAVPGCPAGPENWPR